MTKQQLSLLLYLESRAVDHGGRVDQRRMNSDDFDQVTAWNREGFVQFGRIVFQDANETGGYWVSLSDKAWEAAAHERKARAARAWDVRRFMKTEEKRAS